MFKILLATAVLTLSLFASTATAENLPLHERQRLVHERAMKKAEGRRLRLEARKNWNTIRYYYQPVPYNYHYRYYYTPHNHYYNSYYRPPSGVYFRFGF